MPKVFFELNLAVLEQGSNGLVPQTGFSGFRLRFHEQIPHCFKGHPSFPLEIASASTIKFVHVIA